MSDTNIWNRLTVCKQTNSGLFKDVTLKQFVYKSYILICILRKIDDEVIQAGEIYWETK